MLSVSIGEGNQIFLCRCELENGKGQVFIFGF